MRLDGVWRLGISITGGSCEDERADERVEPSVNARTLLERQRRAFIAAGPPSVALRRNRIDRLLALVLDNTDAFVDAMTTDFGTRSRAATLFTEVVGIIPVIEHTRSHVPRWMKATKLMRAARAAGLRAEVEPRHSGWSASSGRGTSR